MGFPVFPVLHPPPMKVFHVAHCRSSFARCRASSILWESGNQPKVIEEMAGGQQPAAGDLPFHSYEASKNAGLPTRLSGPTSVRFLCYGSQGLFPGAYVSYFVRRKLIGQPERTPSARGIFIVGWTGMRGVVALAAAMSLPETV